jgi:hypothetical protein
VGDALIGYRVAVPNVIAPFSGGQAMIGYRVAVPRVIARGKGRPRPLPRVGSIMNPSAAAAARGGGPGTRLPLRGLQFAAKPVLLAANCKPDLPRRSEAEPRSDSWTAVAVKDTKGLTTLVSHTRG